MTHHTDSLSILTGQLITRISKLFREEAALAGTEMSGKLAALSKKLIGAALGVCLAGAGLIVFLGGLGAFLFCAFESAGLSLALASCLGPAIIGLLVITVGGLLVWNNIKALGVQFLVPQRTLDTLQQLEAPPASPQPPSAKASDERSAPEIEREVRATEVQITGKLEELRDRLTLVDLRRRAELQVRTHPYRWGLLAAGTGFAVSFLMARNLNSPCPRRVTSQPFTTYESRTRSPGRRR